jgi:hypothetical protein
MCCLSRLLLIAILAGPAFPAAQATPDPSGHWEGTIRVPDMEMKIEIDLVKNHGGILAGTFGQPAQGLKGLPLSTVTVDGRSIRFVVRAGEAPATFDGQFSADGAAIAGNVSQGEFTIPFTLTRTGEAQMAPVPKNAAIGKELEGTWYGTLDIGPRQMRVVLTMVNQPDGTAKGTIVSPDGTGVEIPIGIAQKGRDVTLDVPSVSASYVGVLNAAGTELTGTWTQQSSALPLTFRRNSMQDK